MIVRSFDSRIVLSLARRACLLSFVLGNFAAKSILGKRTLNIRLISRQDAKSPKFSLDYSFIRFGIRIIVRGFSLRDLVDGFLQLCIDRV